jgi:hypothetical protein
MADTTPPDSKLLHETFKHLTTLSSGVIVVVVTFGIPPNLVSPHVPLIVGGLALCLLFASTLGSITVMFHIARGGEVSLTMIIFPVGCFALGVGLLVLVAGYRAASGFL